MRRKSDNPAAGSDGNHRPVFDSDGAGTDRPGDNGSAFHAFGNLHDRLVDGGHSRSGSERCSCLLGLVDDWLLYPQLQIASFRLVSALSGQLILFVLVFCDEHILVFL